MNIEYNKNLTAAEYEAISIVQAQNPRFQKIEGEQLRSFYEWFEKVYKKKEERIEPEGQKFAILGHPLFDSALWGRKLLQDYYNLRGSYEKSIHVLAASFGNILAGVQFGFKATNPDVQKYEKLFLEEARNIAGILKTIKPGLKLKYVPKRILHIYHEDKSSGFKNVHHFTVQFAEELAR